jgi:hypothetical protein
MLSIGAFNALLKTLEEPPAHVIFILATTEPQKLPNTIISRCQRYDFKKLPIQSVKEYLKKIEEKEAMNINDEYLEQIAKLGEGSMRDSIGLLEQANSYASNEITLNDIYQISGNISEQKIVEIINKIVEKDVESLLDIFESLYEDGKDFEKISENLMIFLRNILICKNAPMYFVLASNGGTGADAGSISPFATEVRTESGRTSTVASASQDAPLPPPPAPRNTEAANPGSWTTTQGEAPASPPPSSGNRLSRWWGSVRGSSSEPEPAPAPAPAPQSAPRATAAAVPSAWTTQTQPEAGAAPGTRVATASPTAPVPSGGGGNYLLQLSPTRSEAEASALWKTVIKQNQQLASLQPRVEKTDMGNLGTFYRLQIGPFPDKAESLKLCNALKRSGVDCFLVNP